MGFERLDRGVAAGEFGLGKGRVDFVVANLVQESRLTALPAAELRDEVMDALADVRRDGAAAERAHGIAGQVCQSDQSTIGPAGTMPSGFRSSEGEKYPCL